MPSVLKSLMARLKRRRRSRPWQDRRDSSANGANNKESRTDSTDMTHQMARLSITPSRPATAVDEELGLTARSASHHFGEDGFDFTFGFIPSTDKPWPGPVYEEGTRFSPGTYTTISARSAETPPTHKSVRRSQRKKRATSGARARRKSSPPPQDFGPPPTRDPPLHLLNLPGEIRNQIYRLLYVERDPIVAQFRAIIKPKQGPEKPSTTYRRFPRAPNLSLICQQLQREVMTLFYAENKFIFRKHDDSRMSETSRSLAIMTSPDSLAKWRPRQSWLASAITHIELQFKATDQFRQHVTITHTLRQISSTSEIEMETDTTETSNCVCFEHKARAGVLELFQKFTDANPLDAAEVLFLARRERLAGLYHPVPELMPNGDFVFLRAQDFCGSCGCRLLDQVASGM